MPCQLTWFEACGFTALLTMRAARQSMLPRAGHAVGE